MSYLRFPTEESCIEHIEGLRWTEKPVCPYCGTMRKNWKKRPGGYYNCQEYKCCKTFRVTIGNIFHDTKVPLQKWFLALSQVLSAKKGVSSYQLACICDLTQPTAWYMMVRIRKAMQTDDSKLLKGIVEMDETYIGGKPRKKNERIPERFREPGDYNKRGAGTNKKSVVGAVERGTEEQNSKVRVESVKKVNRDTLLSKIQKFINLDESTFITDDNVGYRKAEELLEHKVVPHKGVLCFKRLAR